MRKILAVFGLAALGACAPTSYLQADGTTLTSGSTVYTAKFDRPVAQAVQSECENVGRQVAIDFAWAAGGGLDRTRGGNAYEACVFNKTGAKPLYS